MPYFIYQLISPSGKSYVGISKNVKARWASHKRKARVENKRHPLYDAIRSYGHDEFKVVSLMEFDDQAKAVAAEVSVIRLLGTTDRRYGYNVSEGGEYDAPTGALTFWTEIRKDPAAYARYICNLAEGCRNRAKIIPTHLIEAWRALPAKERWRRTSRALRMANKSPHARVGYVPTPEQSKKISDGIRLAWKNSTQSHKKRHSMTTRKSALAQWARTEPEKKAEIFNKISETLKARHASQPEYHDAVKTQLAAARQNINRSKQGPAAAKGIKQFWIDLRNDPVRYAEYMLSRTASLKVTNARKVSKCG